VRLLTARGPASRSREHCPFRVADALPRPLGVERGSECVDGVQVNSRTHVLRLTRGFRDPMYHSTSPAD
jgi:hypothetical protein